MTDSSQQVNPVINAVDAVTVMLTIDAHLPGGVGVGVGV